MNNDLFAVLAGFGIFLFIFLLVVCILLIVSNWKIFSKAGKPGWASLIPFYNIYIMSDIAFGNINYFIAVLLAWVVSFLGGFLDICILSSLAGLASFVIYIIYCVKLSKAFGRSGGFAVGLVLMPLIFFPILGLGSAEYVGPQ
ncbi:MAG TPA: signal peptidase I [Lachnoclostridium sp.]|nr:signal peptidase I [Lachnoclostridium sp.]